MNKLVTHSLIITYQLKIQIYQLFFLFSFSYFIQTLLGPFAQCVLHSLCVSSHAENYSFSVCEGNRRQESIVSRKAVCGYVKHAKKIVIVIELLVLCIPIYIRKISTAPKSGKGAHFSFGSANSYKKLLTYFPLRFRRVRDKKYSIKS